MVFNLWLYNHYKGKIKSQSHCVLEMLFLQFYLLVHQFINLSVQWHNLRRASFLPIEQSKCSFSLWFWDICFSTFIFLCALRVRQVSWCVQVFSFRCSYVYLACIYIWATVILSVKSKQCFEASDNSVWLFTLAWNIVDVQESYMLS